jgi:hypothetical protein
MHLMSAAQWYSPRDDKVEAETGIFTTVRLPVVGSLSKLSQLLHAGFSE